LLYVSTEWRPVLEIEFVKPQGKPELPPMVVNVEEFISIKGLKAMGNQLSSKRIRSVQLKEALPYELPEPIALDDIEVEDEEDVSTETPAQEEIKPRNEGGEDAQFKLDI
jgi:topoisomerase-4 subunit A